MLGKVRDNRKLGWESNKQPTKYMLTKVESHPIYFKFGNIQERQ